MPSLAIHIYWDTNKQRSISPQKDVVPLFMLGDPQQFDFKAWLAETLTAQDAQWQDILGGQCACGASQLCGQAV